MIIIKGQYLAHKSFFNYLVISCFVTVLDVITSRLCETFTKIVIANTVGVVVGFAVQYILTSRHVYNSRNISTFIKFLLTFLFGLLLANGIVYFCRVFIFHRSEEILAFMVSKGFSIVIPFFVLYFIRKRWINSVPVNSTGVQI